MKIRISDKFEKCFDSIRTIIHADGDVFDVCIDILLYERYKRMWHKENKRFEERIMEKISKRKLVEVIEEAAE